MSAAANFNPIARAYRWLEWFSFGPFLQRCRTAHLESLRTVQNALVLGDGDGRFTARLLAANAAVNVFAVDASDEMLRLLVERAGRHRKRVVTLQADARQFEPEPGRFDLVVSHFFLDCFTTEEVDAIASWVRSAAMPGAMWLISDFDIPAGFFGRVVAAPIVFLLYRAFRWMTGLPTHRLPDYPASLAREGFACIARKCLLAGLLRSELWQVKRAG